MTESLTHHRRRLAVAGAMLALMSITAAGDHVLVGAGAASARLAGRPPGSTGGDGQVPVALIAKKIEPTRAL